MDHIIMDHGRNGPQKGMGYGSYDKYLVNRELTHCVSLTDTLATPFITVTVSFSSISIAVSRTGETIGLNIPEPVITFITANENHGLTYSYIFTM